MGARIRILLVPQTQLVCQLLAVVLQGEADMEVAGCATSVDEVLVRAHRSEVILVDARRASSEALAVVRAVTSRQLSIRVLALGLAEMEGQIMQYIQAGASGYLLGDDSIDDLLERIRDAHSDQVLVSSGQALYNGERARPPGERDSALGPATRSEEEGQSGYKARISDESKSIQKGDRQRC